jgi:hypothetical protein
MARKEPRLFTSFYRSPRIDPKVHATIRISRGHPRWHRPYKDAGAIPELMPDADMLGLPRDEFEDVFTLKLQALDWDATLVKIAELAGDRIPVLLCFENVDDILLGKTWCHRHLVAEWIRGFVDPALPVPEL